MTRAPGPHGVSAGLIRFVGNRIAAGNPARRRLCILNYHRIMARPDPLLESEPTVDTFRWQMDLLANCFNVLPLSEATERLATGTLPPRAVAITFDDGYRSLYELALPVLRERGLPATVFVTSGHMHDESNMWNDVILEAVRSLPAEETCIDLSDIGLDAYAMNGQEQRKQSATLLTERCKYLRPPERRVMLDRLQELTQTDLHQHLMLTPDMLRELLACGIDIGGHTVSHPILARLDDAAAFREIADNKRDLERIIGKPLALFAYPNGKRGIDYEPRHTRMVKEAGYSAAFTTAAGAAAQSNDPFEFPRSRPWDTNSLMFGGRLLQWLHDDK